MAQPQGVKSSMISEIGLAIFVILLIVLMYFSMRCCWSGISKTLGYEDSSVIFVSIVGNADACGG